MRRHNVVGYNPFQQWEVDLARGKARSLVGSYGFTYKDVPDLEQELLLHLDKKRHTRAAWTRQDASERTVMSRILDNRIRDIIEAVQTDLRPKHQQVANPPVGLERFLAPALKHT